MIRDIKTFKATGDQIKILLRKKESVMGYQIFHDDTDVKYIAFN